MVASILRASFRNTTLASLYEFFPNKFWVQQKCTAKSRRPFAPYDESCVRMSAAFVVIALRMSLSHRKSLRSCRAEYGIVPQTRIKNFFSRVFLARRRANLKRGLVTERMGTPKDRSLPWLTLWAFSEVPSTY